MKAQTHSELPLKLEVQAAIQRKISEGCFMCKWIHQAMTPDGRLQNYPLKADGAPLFPVEGQIYHLKQELKGGTDVEAEVGS